MGKGVQLLASGESALLATVMAVQRQVPRVSPLGAHLIVTVAKTVGALDGGIVDRVVVPFLRTLSFSTAFVQQVNIPEDAARAHGMLHGGSVELLVQPPQRFRPHDVRRGNRCAQARGEGRFRYPRAPARRDRDTREARTRTPRADHRGGGRCRARSGLESAGRDTPSRTSKAGTYGFMSNSGVPSTTSIS